MRYLTLLLGALAVAGCQDLTVPDFNNPSLEDIVDNPNRAKITAQAAGLLIGTRAVVSGRAGYISELGVLGRESYNFDGADPRFITELLIGPLIPGNGAFGGNHWVGQYVNIRNANIMLEAVDNVVEFSDTEKEAARGFAKTIQALDLLMVINTRYENGAVIDVDRDPRDDPAPIVSRSEVLAQIANLLDQAEGHLAAGGASFPFPLSSGFTGFDTPTTFLEFNRGLRARVAVYAGEYSTALTALSGSFLDESGSLDAGVFHVFSTGSGDALNALFDPSSTPDILAHPSIEADAQLQGDGTTLDDRFVRKVQQLSVARTTSGITTDLAFRIYTGNTAPIPIMRNEELLLLRAEANIGLGSLNDALTDLNVVRQGSGLLDPIASFADAAEATDELLYNRRYSLLFEGHRWIDTRRFDRLDALPLDLPEHNIFDRFPIPQGECDARDPQPAVCSN